VECRGYEDILADCPHSSYDDCGAGEAAGVICGEGDSQGTSASLTAEGGLIFEDDSESQETNGTGTSSAQSRTNEDVDSEAIEPGNFCLIEGYTAKSRREERFLEGLVAVSCDSCKEEVTCTYADHLFGSLARRHGDIRDPSIVAIGDQNGDYTVDFEEFFSKLKDYVRKVFGLFDDDKDGSLFAEASTGNILQQFSLQFFEEVLNEAFDFFDSNNDNTIDFDDDYIASSSRWSDRNDDGEVTLSEMLGTSIISLPAPIYNFYSTLDRNTDEKLAKDEALDFIRRLFTIIDSDSDCHITTGEVVALLKDVGVSWDHQLAVRMVLQQYLTLASSIVNTFINRANVNKDSKVTVEEVLTFNNFDFIEDVVATVVDLGVPSGSFSHLIGGRSYRRRTREEDEELVAMWFRALQSLMEKATFTGGAPEPSCSGDS